MNLEIKIKIGKAFLLCRNFTIFDFSAGNFTFILVAYIYTVHFDLKKLPPDADSKIYAAPS